MIEELVREKDKWHRRFNDALIEIAKLTAENTNLEEAIKKLIQERDCAMKDIWGCEFCINYKTDERGFCLNRTSYEEPCGKWIWRGINRPLNPKGCNTM